MGITSIRCDSLFECLFHRQDGGCDESHHTQSEAVPLQGDEQEVLTPSPIQSGDESPSKEPKKIRVRWNTYYLEDALLGELNWRSDPPSDSYLIDDLEKGVKWVDCCHVVFYVDFHILG